MSDAFWGMLGAVLVALIGGPLLVLVKHEDKPMPAPAPTPEREHVEACHGVPTADMSDNLVKIIARMDDRFETQSARMQTVEKRLTEAVDEVSSIHDWLDDGMPDPPGRPARPSWAPTKRTIH